MRLGGLQPSSMIDFPGKVCCVIFFSGCNFHCPYCHNPRLVAHDSRGPADASLTEEAVLRFLTERRGFLDGVVLSGGEPTLQAQSLVRLCKQIKLMGFSIKLDTNGSRPAVIRRLLDESLVDYMAMDIKADPKNHRVMEEVFQTDCPAGDLIQSIEMILAAGVGHEFRTTCFSPVVDKAAVLSICRLIRGADLYALQRFRDTEVLDPDFFKANAGACSRERMESFCRMAAPFVSQCILR